MSTPSQDIASTLLSYTGPEKDAVRNAIIKLAGEDLSEMRHLVSRAQTGYRQILWEASAAEPAPSLLESVAGLTFYQRLHRLNRVQQWQEAVKHRDRTKALALLRQCAYNAVDSEKLIASEFSAPK